jgi:hypothetical protein
VTLLVVLLVGVTLGATLSHATALKAMKASIETDFKALHARFDALKEKL